MQLFDIYNVLKISHSCTLGRRRGTSANRAYPNVIDLDQTGSSTVYVCALNMHILSQKQYSFTFINYDLYDILNLKYKYNASNYDLIITCR